MSEIVRFTVSLESDLLERFDAYCTESQFATRSEAIRQLLRETLTSNAWAEDSKHSVATLTLVYDHHKGSLSDNLRDIQHDHVGVVVSSMHVHLDHHHCLEVIILRGPAKELQNLAEKLRGLKGIHAGRLVIASAD